MASSAADTIAGLIRDIADFPQPGVMYKDITPLLGDPAGFGLAVDLMTEPWLDDGIETVAGIEARGFILGPAVARTLGAGFVPVRKAGKLPWSTFSVSYDLEYGVDTVELHTDALAAGRRTLVIDDVLATGGTAAATARLIKSTEANLVGFGFLLELGFLTGRAVLGGDHRIEVVLTVPETERL